MTTWRRLVPIIPARNIRASAEHYRDLLGFEIVHIEPEYGILRRGPSELHLWGPSGIAPERSNTMLRVEVDGIDDLYAECQRLNIVHPNAPLHREAWGTREFAIRDLDGNLITFFSHEE